LERRFDLQSPGLARKGVSLDIFGELRERAGSDSVSRVRNAAFSYHAALKQDSVEAATVFFVTALEALLVPSPKWRREKVTQRFIDGIQELCPEAIDALLASPNVDHAFGFRKRGAIEKQRSKLLDLIYTLRSSPVHEGIGPSSFDFMDLAAPENMRSAFLSGLVQAAILNFIGAPRSFLIGHPMFEKAPIGIRSELRSVMVAGAARLVGRRK
jgi:hypothetical protein